MPGPLGADIARSLQMSDMQGALSASRTASCSISESVGCGKTTATRSPLAKRMLDLCSNNDPAARMINLPPHQFTSSFQFGFVWVRKIMLAVAAITTGMSSCLLGQPSSAQPFRPDGSGLQQSRCRFIAAICHAENKGFAPIPSGMEAHGPPKRTGSPDAKREDKTDEECPRKTTDQFTGVRYVSCHEQRTADERRPSEVQSPGSSLKQIAAVGEFLRCSNQQKDAGPL